MPPSTMAPAYRELEDGSSLVDYIEDSVVESQGLLVINGPPEGHI